MTVSVTGVGVAMPGVDGQADLLAARKSGAEPVDPAAILGRKGLRYKDRATQLGLCAAIEALRDAGLRTDDGLTVSGDDVAVVVSSNLGNVDTVCRVARSLVEETSSGLSPMDAPNLSSNVIASEIAIRFGLRGPNLTVCNGDTSGLDAMHWATTLLRSGRARVVLVVGVEPDNDDVRALTKTARVVDGGAALVLETATSAGERGAAVKASVGPYVRADAPQRCLTQLLDGGAAPELVLVPENCPTDITCPDTAAVHDLAANWGTASGALGTLQCAAAVGWFAAGGGTSAYAMSGSGSEAAAGLLLSTGAP